MASPAVKGIDLARDELSGLLALRDALAPRGRASRPSLSS